MFWLSEVKYSLALAREGACKARQDHPVEEQVGDNGMYKSDDDKENLRDEREAEPDISVEKIQEEQEAATYAQHLETGG